VAPSQPEYIGPSQPSQLLYDDDGNVAGVRKLRYVPVALQELDVLPGDALRVLLLIRRVCDRDETDGKIDDRALKALALEHGIGRKRFETALQFLVRSAHVFRIPGALVDAHFHQVCSSANERAVLRERWKRAQRSHRAGMSRDDEP
jgi:hypothetical protein